MFLALLLVGFFGFVFMTAMGFIHVGDHGITHHAPAHQGPVSHGSVSGAAHHGPASSVRLGGQGGRGPAHNKGAVRGGGAKGDRTAAIFMMLSPVTVFGLMMGAGATGLLLQNELVGPRLVAASVLGALIFSLGIIRPLMNMLSNFASRPSEGLEGMVARTATAVTRFDEAGRGLISVTFDGQQSQVLATLEPDEVARSVQVAKGDRVTIVEVDKVRNTCRVTRELAQ